MLRVVPRSGVDPAHRDCQPPGNDRVGTNVKLVLPILLFVLFELAVFSICMSGRLRANVFARPLRRGFVFFGAQIVLLAFLALGSYAESLWGLASRVSEFLGPDPIVARLPVAYPSDPGLVATLERIEPMFARPVFGDRQSFRDWQDSLRSHLLESIFEIPEISQQVPVRFERLAREQIGPGLTRTKIVYETFDGSHIPGYLFEPELAADSPAILVVPGHAPEGQSGLAQTAGLVESYQQGAALNLAKAGFVTLTLELRGFGELGWPYDTEHRLVAWNAILAGTFYKAIIIRDLKFAVDLLRGLPIVDPQRLGITGASYGGELAVTYAALDKRIKAVSTHSGGGGLGRQTGVVGTKRDQPHYGHIVPGSSEFLNKEDMLLLLAPRPTQILRGDRESFAHPDFEQAILSAWRTLDSENEVRLATAPGGHGYFPEPAIEFFRLRL